MKSSYIPKVEPVSLTGFSNLKQVCETFSFSPSSCYEKIQNRQMVPPVKGGLRKSLWPNHELDAIARAMIKGYSQSQLRQLVTSLIDQRSKIDVPTFGGEAK